MEVKFYKKIYETTRECFQEPIPDVRFDLPVTVSELTARK